MKLVKHFGKRSLATILALVMCLGLMGTALAEGKSVVLVKGDSLKISGVNDYVLVSDMNGETWFGEMVKLVPDDGSETITKVEWSSDDTSIVTVGAGTFGSAGVAKTNKITGIAEGSTTLTAKVTTSAGNTYEGKIPVIVGNPSAPVQSVTLNKTTLDLTIGGSETLNATVLPDNATDKTVTWTSDNSAVASVDSNGTVTAVSAGTATITATAGGQSATCAVNVTNSVVATDAFTFAISANAEKVTVGSNVTITVTANSEDGTLPDGAKGMVSYDTDKFDLKSGETAFNRIGDITDNTVLTLTFTATAAGTGTFTLSDAVAGTYNQALGSAPAPQTVSTNVEVVNEHTVTYVNGASTTTETVTHGAKPTQVPNTTDTTPEYHEFKGWQKGEDAENLLTADAVKALEITEDITFTAVYAPCTYNVTLDDSLTGETTATYGEDYEVTISNADMANYNYTVTYTIGDTEQTITVSEGTTATIPGANITGDMTVSVTKALKVEVKVHENYVTGYTLVLAKGEGPYTYSDSAMFYVEQYKAYAWLVEGSVSEEDATANVALGSEKAVILDRGNDVNGSGAVDFYDAIAAHGCYKVAYGVSEQMALYLSADVNGDYVVDAADVSAVQTNK